MPLRYIMQKFHYDESLALAGDQLVIISWTAAWSQDNTKFFPTYMQLSEEYKDKAMFIVCDIDEADEFVIEMNVPGVPIFWFIKNKEIVEKIEGIDEPLFREYLTKYTS